MHRPAFATAPPRLDRGAASGRLRGAQWPECTDDEESVACGPPEMAYRLQPIRPGEDDMRHRAILSVIGAALMLAACDFAVERRQERSRRHAFDHVDRVLDRVEATDVQRLRARAILSRTMTDLEPWPATGRRLREDLTAAWRTDAPDRAMLHRRVDAEIEAMRGLGHALVDDALALHGVLRSEQREALVRDARAWWR
jgi:hypothetical protein